jgi:lipopolysaccharide/colanic/teichoic acid biosynthesis glycosyltransferase
MRMTPPGWAGTSARSSNRSDPIPVGRGCGDGYGSPAVNVLRGELSLVGPRPLSAEQVDANIELLGPRHEVRAGITGWWQIHGRSDIDPEDAVRMDQFYIENWSPALDAYILLRTVGVVVKRKGAY